MDKKTVGVILALALIVSFFLPYFGFGPVGLSPKTIVFGAGNSSDNAVRFLWLLIPIIGVILLLDSLGRGSSMSDSISWIPIAVLVFFIARTFILTKISVGDYISTLRVGYWIALVASVLLAFYKPRR